MIVGLLNTQQSYCSCVTIVAVFYLDTVRKNLIINGAVLEEPFLNSNKKLTEAEQSCLDYQKLSKDAYMAGYEEARRLIVARLEEERNSLLAIDCEGSSYLNIAIEMAKFAGKKLAN